MAPDPDPLELVAQPQLKLVGAEIALRLPVVLRPLGEVHVASGHAFSHVQVAVADVDGQDGVSSTPTPALPCQAKEVLVFPSSVPL